MVVTEIVQGTSARVIRVVTPTPEPTGSRTLVICQAEFPGPLNDFLTENMAELAILPAIYDGPIDSNAYAYQPVILEKLPSLADGDAWLSVVTVHEGDRVVDAHGEVILLVSNSEEPVQLVPAGGGEPVDYQGGDFQMDQLSATFTLLPNLVWSDGAPLTASDSVFAFELKTDPDGYNSINYLQQRTASYQLGEDEQGLTTIWTGLPGFYDPTYYTNFFSPKPEHVLSQYEFDNEEFNVAANRTPLGWGPYVVGEWVEGESITFHKNPNYFRADKGLPRFETLVFRFIGGNSNTGLAALLTGECDILGTQVDDQIDLILELQSSGLVSASLITGTVWEHITFGIQHFDYDDGYQAGIDPPDIFSDVRVRQAFMLCLDRQSVVDTVTFGRSRVLDTYVPPEHPLFNPQVRHYEFDPEAGSALLEQAGWLDEDGDPTTPRIARGVKGVPDGTRLQVTYETSDTPLRQQVTAILQQSLAECGIQADVYHHYGLTLFDGGDGGTVFSRRFHLGEFAWLTGAEPGCDMFLSSQIPGFRDTSWISIMDGQEREFTDLGWGGNNIGGFVNQDFDQACSTAMNSLKGQPEYITAHQEAQRIFAEQLPTLPLFQRLKVAVARPDMCNYILDPTQDYNYWNIEKFDYGDGCVE
jgi:peptide/nickel transport system substrate-binding protein